MILVDTGPLVALCDERDKLHRRALRELDDLPLSGRGVCLPVLAEALFLLSAVHLRKRLELLFEENIFEPYPLREPEHRLSQCFQWLEEYEEHAPDFADAYLIVASSAEANSRIWTFDREFSTVWRLPNGRPVRLA